MWKEKKVKKIVATLMSGVLLLGSGGVVSAETPTEKEGYRIDNLQVIGKDTTCRVFSNGMELRLDNTIKYPDGRVVPFIPPMFSDGGGGYNVVEWEGKLCARVAREIPGGTSKQKWYAVDLYLWDMDDVTQVEIVKNIVPKIIATPNDWTASSTLYKYQGELGLLYVNKGDTNTANKIYNVKIGKDKVCSTPSVVFSTYPAPVTISTHPTNTPDLLLIRRGVAGSDDLISVQISTDAQWKQTSSAISATHLLKVDTGYVDISKGYSADNVVEYDAELNYVGKYTTPLHRYGAVYLIGENSEGVPTVFVQCQQEPYTKYSYQMRRGLPLRDIDIPAFKYDVAASHAYVRGDDPLGLIWLNIYGRSVNTLDIDTSNFKSVSRFAPEILKLNLSNTVKTADIGSNTVLRELVVGENVETLNLGSNPNLRIIHNYATQPQKITGVPPKGDNIREFYCMKSNYTFLDKMQDNGWKYMGEPTPQVVDKTKPIITDIVKTVSFDKQSMQLEVKATDDSTEALQYSINNGVTWQASNVFTVKNNGTVVVKVKDKTGNISESANLNITELQVVTAIKILGGDREIGVGEPLTLTTDINPTFGKTLEWMSSNPSVATVSNGEIIALTEGITDITVKVEGTTVTDTVKLTVTKAKKPVISFDIVESSLELEVGNIFEVQYNLLPVDADNKLVRWESTNPTVATVLQDNKVIATTKGVAVIKGTTVDGNKTDMIIVTVKDKAPVEKVVNGVSLIAPDGIQKEYTKGDTIKTNYSIRVEYEDGSSENIPVTTSMVSGDTNLVGESVVTITYKGKTTTYTINVAEKVTERSVVGIKIEDESVIQKEYQVGEVYNPKGYLEVTYSDGVKELVRISQSMVTNINTSKEGTSFIQLTFMGKTVEYDITVKPLPQEKKAIKVELVDLSVFKTEYKQGEKFKPVGELKITFNDGTTAIQTVQPQDVSYFDTAEVGSSFIRLLVQGVTVEYPVEVKGVTLQAVTVSAEYTNVAPLRAVKVTVKTTGEVDYITLPNGAKIYKDTLSYTFTENGSYVFTVYSKDGVSTASTVVEIGCIDKEAPVITFNYSVDDLSQVNVTVYEDNFLKLITPKGVEVFDKISSFDGTKNQGTFTAFDTAGNIGTKDFIRLA